MYIGIFVIFYDISGFQRHGFLQIISISVEEEIEGLSFFRGDRNEKP